MHKMFFVHFRSGDFRIQLLMELLGTIKVSGYNLLSAAMSTVVLFHRREPM